MKQFRAIDLTKKFTLILPKYLRYKNYRLGALGTTKINTVRNNHHGKMFLRNKLTQKTENNEEVIREQID